MLDLHVHHIGEVPAPDVGMRPADLNLVRRGVRHEENLLEIEENLYGSILDVLEDSFEAV